MIARDGTMEMVRGQVFLQAQGAYYPFCADLLTLNRSIHHAPLCQPTVMLVANASHLWKPQSPQEIARSKRRLREDGQNGEWWLLAWQLSACTA